jgi:hypothetical protein
MRLRVFGVDLGTGALVALGALAIVTVTVVVTALARSGRQPTPASQTPSAAVVSVPFHEFVLSEEYRQIDDGFVVFRERLPAWSREQVEQFWQPVEDVIEAYLRRQNDRRIELLFAEVP